MATTRGFVEQIEAGRGGLVRVTVVGPAGRGVFTVSDIDGDPERFNERLTKVALLRDAMNRAEPVEIETASAKAQEIDRVARITRDALVSGSSLRLIGGILLRVQVESRNDTTGPAEVHDVARIELLDTGGLLETAVLDLQAPERLVAAEQLRILRTAQESGTQAQLLVADPPDGGDTAVVTVWLGEDGGGRGEQDTTTVVSGFVETLGLLLPAGIGAAAGALALARLTTSPELTGPGGSVDPSPFEPQSLALALARGSVPYTLLEAGLRDNVRVRVRYADLSRGRDDAGGDGRVKVHDASAGEQLAGQAFMEFGAGAGSGSSDGSVDVAADPRPVGLVLAVELQAPLVSASRPVWVHIDREMLDRGPDADCVPGLPSSSLKVRTLRDLRIPYPAEWLGQGCFNHGVYRFELSAPAESVILVDDEQICLFPTGDDDRIVVGYACLEGDHIVRIQIPEYLCDTEFDLDVYRVR